MSQLQVPYEIYPHDVNSQMPYAAPPIYDMSFPIVQPQILNQVEQSNILEKSQQIIQPGVYSSTIDQAQDSVAPSKIYDQQELSAECIQALKNSGLYSILENLVQSVIDIPMKPDGTLARTLDITSLKRSYTNILQNNPHAKLYMSYSVQIAKNLLQKKLNVWRSRKMPKNDMLYMNKLSELLTLLMN